MYKYIHIKTYRISLLLSLKIFRNSILCHRVERIILTFPNYIFPNLSFLAAPIVARFFSNGFLLIDDSKMQRNFTQRFVAIFLRYPSRRKQILRNTIQKFSNFYAILVNFHFCFALIFSHPIALGHT